MKKIFIAAGAAAALLTAGKLAAAVGYYRRVFTRRDDGVLDETDLSGTHYARHKDALCAAIARMRGEKHENVSIINREKMRLCGEYYDRGGSTTVIMAHGYHSNPLNNFSVSGAMLLDRGYNVLFVHQRTHLDSDGKFISMGQKEQYDLLDWIDYAAKDDRIRNIVVYGTSMGGSAVAYMSDKVTEPKVKALVVDCGFDVPNDILKLQPAKSARVLRAAAEPFLTLIVRIFSGTRLRYGTTNSLRRAARPVCFIHGGKDTTVYPYNVKRTYCACASEKKLIAVPEAGHTTALMVGGREAADELLSFMERFLDNGI